MEVYILDGLLRRTAVFDKFESLVWTERWRESGDFELDLKSTLENRSQFLVGSHLAINESYRVMKIESVEDGLTSEGKQALKVKGRSLEAILDDRVAKYSMSHLVAEPKWVITDTPAEVARTMFDHICRAPGGLSAADVIPFLQSGTIFPPETIPESTTPIRWEQEPASLYSAIHEICNLYDLGFRLVRNFDTSQLYFNIYTGNDRTTRQTVLRPVVFAPGFDNLQNTTEFNTIEKSKNVAYVFSDEGYVVVYGEDVDPLTQGFDRRVISVRVNIDDDDPDPNARMIQAGEEALRNARASSIFDGELNQYSEYKYGVDYDLGDLTEMRNKDGIITYKRVTEQIFVSDAEGERSYPTLALDMFADVNTWIAWSNKLKTWSEFTTEEWEDM